MDRITRYLFILVCLVAFLVLAPAIVLYVSGTSFDLDNGDTKQTGIFTVETNPDNAQVKVDGRSPENTPATIRFLPQGEYGFTISKDGYFDWFKRLLVEPSKVTYGHEGVDKLNLIKLPVAQTLIPNGVTSFVLVDNTVWFGSGAKVGHAPIDNPAGVKFISSPIAVGGIAVLRNNNYLLVSNAAGRKVVINRSTGTALPLPTSFDDATDINVSNSGVLLARIGTTIYSYDFTTKTTSDLLLHVVGFTLIDSTAYIANKESGETTLQAIEWNGAAFTDAEPVINTILPNADNIELFITERKELFALINEVMYRINAKPEAVSAHVIAANLDYTTNELTFRTPSELWFYNFIQAKPQLLTRNTATVNDFKIRSVLGYGFIASPAGLEMLEIDARYQQNHYVLAQGTPVWAFAISNNLKTVVALSGNQLLIIPVR